MIFTFLCLISAASAFPASVLYDRRQDGDFNVAADVQNILVLIAVPEKMSIPSFDLSDFLKSNGQTRHAEAQERADHVMEAFVEPNTPYQVEIGSDRSADGGARAVEVVIAGRRRLETEPQEAQESNDEYKLIGATEQCGPDRERDPVTLTCRLKQLDIADEIPVTELSNSVKKDVEDAKKTPEAVPS